MSRKMTKYANNVAKCKMSYVNKPGEGQIAKHPFAVMFNFWEKSFVDGWINVKS